MIRQRLRFSETLIPVPSPRGRREKIPSPACGRGVGVRAQRIIIQ
jgi:hypothetical protein